LRSSSRPSGVQPEGWPPFLPIAVPPAPLEGATAEGGGCVGLMADHASRLRRLSVPVTQNDHGCAGTAPVGGKGSSTPAADGPLPAVRAHEGPSGARTTPVNPGGSNSAHAMRAGRTAAHSRFSGPDDRLARRWAMDVRPGRIMHVHVCARSQRNRWSLAVSSPESHDHLHLCQRFTRGAIAPRMGQ
jgi:hypothetical protein